MRVSEERYKAVYTKCVVLRSGALWTLFHEKRRRQEAVMRYRWQP